ncbi:TLD [Seminavis robusta]|uniref:TLD n=1 Tax=Seminavis robusta TaxID=568900 RepID=A0A9N8HIR1_9STRA|nr:TLD [Seminavis robusta]|eukprot:Sro611_g175250.1 TLD (250) ;mRNA; r:8127-8876
MKSLLWFGCLWALTCDQLSSAFVQNPTAATTFRQETKLNSILDTLSSIGGIAPPQPILFGNKGLLKSLLSGTYLESNIDNLECCYKASRDGWSAIDFHTKVDDKGSGLVVARTRTGVTVGGFNPNGWRSTDDYYLSNTAFLWHAQGSKAVKSPIYPGSNAGVYDYATGGPNFGAEDLVLGAPQAAIMGGFAGPDMENVSANAGNLKQGRCSFSGAYDFSNQWPIRGRFQLVEVEVYCAGSAGGKRKSFW